MPKSDTWPGGAGLETMNGMDSAGSCDSVVSVNSGFSDDSLEHLSAEEKACLMFLEETIESLNTEEDSGLSNDEPDQLPSPGSLATKLADLSASMSKTKLDGSQKPAFKEPIKRNVESKPMPSYLVPTPLVVAGSPPCSVASTRPVAWADKAQSVQQTHPPVPLEVHVLIPHATKPKDPSARTAEAPLLRGPLSYDALVHLRRTASNKKTPLCPTVDHTIDLEENHDAPKENPNSGDLHGSNKSHSEVSRSKAGPPAVAPKPKYTPPNISVKTLNGGSMMPDVSCSVSHAADSQVVRLEALKKLGLLRNQKLPKGEKSPQPPGKPPPSLDPTPSRITRGPSNWNPTRSPSFCSSQAPTEPTGRPLQGSASFHHPSRQSQQPAPRHPAGGGGWRAGALGRSASLDTDGRTCPQPQNLPAATSVPPGTASSVGYSVVVVPGMGADRKEALRKLGLLKEGGR
ncbi:unnamed protein product [Menidia menidia]|uniref:(Atlantic silverside) hypothetical protein n=1 Tax=Menidia menidia TaxID=238744 RepID=A0A8S4BDE6_9TELE|nr:unnamed protein product [Menidia menidia]